MKLVTISNVTVARSKLMSALEKARTVPEAKLVRDQAKALGDYLRQQRHSFDCQQMAAELKLRAEYKLGELIPKQFPHGDPGERKANGCINPRSRAVTLGESGISRMQSSRWQLLRTLPVSRLNGYIEESINRRKEITTNTLLKEAKRAKAIRARKLSKPAQVDSIGPFDLIVADPPWLYEHCGVRNWGVENHYPPASLARIRSHKPDASKNSILLLWATAPKLEEALQVMTAWGFKYRTCAVWDKELTGMGYWWRVQHELLLLGTRGKPRATPESERIPSLFRSRRGKHSVKPVAVMEWIERAFPHLSKLEMYCRSPRPGWAAWGNEVETTGPYVRA